jgi:predicted nucleic acid-binding protein
VSQFVVDASVAVKWFLPAIGETLADEAMALLARYTKEDARFLVPDLFWVECASVAWKAVRKGRLPKVSADAALAALTRYDFPTFPTVNLQSKAFEIATAHGRTVYDSLYVALALQTNSQLITADERLANALAARFPVKWLGAISQ